MLAADITLDLLLNSYASGVFPMSDSRDDNSIFWLDPDMRGIFPLDGFHCPKSLKRFIRKQPFTVTYNKAFQDVVQNCAAQYQGRSETWISREIEDLYCGLNACGFAHSIECWQEDQLVGGLYGVCLRGGFFGESMFSKVSNASKVALVYLMARLNHGKFTLLDTQFQTDHLKSLGCIEIAREDYKILLKEAMDNQTADFYSLPDDASVETILQESTQMS